MLNQEDLYKCIYNKDWTVIIKTLYKNKKDIQTDTLLTQAAKTFESVFFNEVKKISLDDKDVLENLENLYILHNGKFYLLSNENYKCLVLELIQRKPLVEAYNYATLFPNEKISIDKINAYNKHKTEEKELSVSNTGMDSIQVYNRLFELINEQNDSATYFSGSRFINTVKEFQPYFPDYTQYIDLRNNEGKSTSRKIYYYDILISLPPEIRNSVIDRILDITRPFKGEKVQAIEEILGKKPKVITLNFKDNFSNVSDQIQNAPVVFISYSWDSDAHKEWVLNLANRLVTDGVDVILDRYYLKPGKHLQHFVEDSIKRANRILIIFTPNYKLKADKREGGVGYEYSIMNVDLYKHQTGNDKVIPVLRAGSTDESIPAFMQQFIHINIANDANYENSYKDLLREIHNEPTIVKPKVGVKPSF